MKNDRINYLAVGMFVLVMLGLLLAVLFRLTGARGDTDIYYAYFDNISGLNRSAPVSFEGYPMGHILAIEPTQKNGKTGYRLTLSVKEDWKIPRDSVARITAFSLLSEFVIDIHQGVSKDDLRPGDVLQGQQDGDFFSALNGAKPLLDKINHQVDTLGGALETRVPALLKDLKTLLTKLNNNADALKGLLNKDNQRHVARLLQNADATSVNLLQLSSDVNRTRAQLDTLLKDSGALLKASSPQLRASVTQLRNALDLVADNIDAIMQNTAGTSRNMYELSRELRQNPGLLLSTTPPHDAVKNTAPPRP